MRATRPSLESPEAKAFLGQAPAIVGTETPKPAGKKAAAKPKAAKKPVAPKKLANVAAPIVIAETKKVRANPKAAQPGVAKKRESTPVVEARVKPVNHMLELPPALHKRIKMAALEADVPMYQLILNLLNKTFA